MAPSYDCSASVLLCAEDNSILGFEEEEEETEVTSFQDLDGNRIKSRGFSARRAIHGNFLENFPLQSEECLALLVKRETDHLPLEGYYDRLIEGSLELSIRETAIDWIWKVHRHYNFGPLSAALAVNFLDRFLSAYELPQGKAWMTQLLSVACLSLAAKMEETYVPLLLDLQVCDAKYVFEAKTIQRMELLVLSTLKWRMQAVTPFSCLDYFLHKFNNGTRPAKFSLYQASDLILDIVKETDFLEFRPSEIAAAVALAVIGDIQVVNIESALSCCNHVSQASVLRCYEAIQSKYFTRNLALQIHYYNNDSNDSSSVSVASVPHSPIGVLDAACLSYKRCESHAVGHDIDTSSPSSKRRRVWR